MSAVPRAMLLLTAGHSGDLLVKLPEALLSRSVSSHLSESRLWPNSSHMDSSREERHWDQDLEAGAHAKISIAFPFLVLSLFILLPVPGSSTFSRRGQWLQRPLILPQLLQNPIRPQSCHPVTDASEHHRYETCKQDI